MQFLLVKLTLETFETNNCDYEQLWTVQLIFYTHEKVLIKSITCHLNIYFYCFLKFCKPDRRAMH